MTTIALYFLLLVGLAPPLGAWMYRVYTRESTGRVEGVIYRLSGVRATVEQSWRRYAVGVIWCSVVCSVLAYLVMRLQSGLPLNPAELPAVDANVAFNTAASFMTNTNWQAYAGETTMSYLTSMIALTFLGFVSAGVGMAVLVAFARGFTRAGTDQVGNFWRDLVRSIVYILMPLSIALTIVMISQGVVQTFAGPAQVQGIQGFAQTITRGPAASWIAIKQLGTNGGGFFGANSAHPFENPNDLTNFLEMLSILAIPAALTYTFGRMVGRPRQGWAILAAMLALLAGGVAITAAGERHSTLAMREAGIEVSAPNLEGKEVRFGADSSSMWATAATASSYGGVNAMHASFNPAAGVVQIVNMNSGVFGADGGGLYQFVFLVIIAVLMGSLMVGRTPEYLGKKIGAREIKLAMIAVLVPFLFVVGGTAVASVTTAGLEARLNDGAHGFTEILYAFSSLGNNNGSAFAGLDASTPFYAIFGGVIMLFGRYVPMLAALAMAGGLARAGHVPETPGTLRTDSPLFVGLLIGVILLVSAPLAALTLGPVVEHLRGVIP